MPSRPIRDLDDAVAFVHSLIRAEPRGNAARERIGLAPMRSLLDRLDNPQRGMRCIHIAGSKGKGTTALLLEALLQRAGRRTATFTSPHLQRWTERFRVAGREIPDTRLCAVMEHLRPHVLELRSRGEDSAPSFFDVLAAAALSIFREADVECVILETGLGGRLDATNVVEPAIACITSVELEHTDKLGAELRSVAREKAGIVKPGAALVLGELPGEARAEVEQRARALGVQPARFGREFAATPGDGGQWVFRDEALRLSTPLSHPGRAFAHNAALALACASRSGLVSRELLAEVAREVFAQVTIPGRLQVLGRAPRVIVDGAHTEQSIRALRDTLVELPAAGLHLVVSVARGKEAERVLGPLLADAARVVVTTADPERSVPAATLADAVKAYRPDLDVATVDDPIAAVRLARRAVPRRGTLCITGSMYMAGAGLTALAAPTSSTN